MAQLECVFVASGEMQAQQVRAFLEAAGVPTMERGEALRNTHGLTLDGLGAVEILVAAGDADQARRFSAPPKQAHSASPKAPSRPQPKRTRQRRRFPSRKTRGIDDNFVAPTLVAICAAAALASV